MGIVMDLLQTLKICFLLTLVVQTHSLNITENVTDENIKTVLSSTVSYEDKIKRVFKEVNEAVAVRSSNETEPSSILIVFFATAAGFILVLGVMVAKRSYAKRKYRILERKSSTHQNSVATISAKN